MGDIADIVNVASSVVKILASNETESMGKLATALPRGIDPLSTGGEWQRVERPLAVGMIWECSHPSVCDDDLITIGVVWTFGGSVNGKGRYIKDAEAYSKIGHIGPTYNYDIFVKFAESGTPIGPEPVAMLTGTFNVRVSRTVYGIDLGVVSSRIYGFQILGDGSGHLHPL
jgi:hypothetical protein